MSLRRRLLLNASSNAYGEAVSLIIQIVSIPILLHSWGVGTYGEWLILSAIPTLLLLSDIGFTSAAGNQMTIHAAREEWKEYRNVLHSLTVLLTTICVAVILVGSIFIFVGDVAGIFNISRISSTDSTWICFILIFQVVISLFAGAFSAIFRSTKRFALGQFLQHNIRLLEGLTLMGLALSGFSVLHCALGACITRLITTLCSGILAVHGRRDFRLGFIGGSIARVRQLIRPASGALLYTTGSSLSLSGLTMIGGAALGGPAIAVINVCRTFSRVPLQIANVISRAIWPEVSALYASDEKEKLKQIIGRFHFYCFWSAVAACFFLFLFSARIFEIWTHGAIAADKLILSLFLLASLFNVAWQTSWVALTATNQQFSTGLAYAVSSIVVTGGCVGILGTVGAPAVPLTLLLINLFMAFFANFCTFGVFSLGNFFFLKSLFFIPKFSRAQ